jgi:hypothetical protein
MTEPAQPTLAEQLREMIVPPACVELIEQAAARLNELEDALSRKDQTAHGWAEKAGVEYLRAEAAEIRCHELERQLAKVQYWRDRHCRESEQHAQRSGENWKAWKAAERQLATVAQEECERCATICEEQNKFTPWQDKEHYKMAAQCAYAIRALTPHAGEEPEAAQAVANESESATERRTPTITTEPAPASGPDGEDCSDEPDKQFIEAIMVEKSELNRLRTVAEAAKAEVKSNAWASLTLVAAVRALERGEAKS